MTDFSFSSVSPIETVIKSKRNAIPLYATFELTPRCNMNCGMCYVHLKNSEIQNHGRELTADEWLKLGSEAINHGSLFLTITGGEPLMYPKFDEIYPELCKMGFVITLQSNLYHISDECFDLIAKYPPKCIKFTIYGASNETYKKVCGVADGFTQVKNNIIKLKNLGVDLIAVTTITKDNVKDLQKISELMNEYNIQWSSSAAIKKSGRNIENFAEKYRIDDNFYADLCNDVNRSIEKFRNKKAIKPCEICNEYRTGFWIKWNGKMGFCSFFNEPDIDVIELGFENSWKKLIEFEDNLNWPKKCLTCEISQVCPRCLALIATESGTLEAVNEDYCKYIKNLLNKTEVIKNG